MEERDNMGTVKNGTLMSPFDATPDAGRNDFLLLVSSKTMYKIGEKFSFDQNSYKKGSQNKISLLICF